MCVECTADIRLHGAKEARNKALVHTLSNAHTQGVLRVVLAQAQVLNAAKRPGVVFQLLSLMVCWQDHVVH